MGGKTTKGNGRKKPKRIPAAEKLTRRALKQMQARLVRCNPWLADPEQPR
jgi:hypothetical protein